MQSIFLKVLTFVGRLLGVFWVLVGVAFVASAFIGTNDRAMHFLIGALLLLVGIGFGIAEPANSADVDRVRRFLRRISHISKR